MLSLDILKKTCRICFQEASESIDLFSESESAKEILKMIFDCFQISLYSEKHLPFSICQQCVEEINNANGLRLKCVSINKRFKDYCEKTLQQKLVELDPSLEFSDDNQSIINGNVNRKFIDTIEKADTNIKNHFRCSMCNKVLKSMKSLLKHVVCMHEKRKHIGRVSGFGPARRYYCNNCSYSTPHKQTLVNHIRRHKGERPFSCECGKSFTQSSTLAAHCKTHSNTSNFTCSQCGKQFKHAFSLKTHLHVHDVGKFSCNVCTKVLKSKENLRIHLKRHAKDYNYNCEDCGNTFITSAELSNHRLKHSMEKNIKCHICSYSTNARKNLVMHLKRHAGDKSFKCDSCEKSFYTHGDMRRHMRVHTREKPYSCQTCPQRFTYSSCLNKHMQTVHGIQYRWGDVKSKETRIRKVTLKV